MAFQLGNHAKLALNSASKRRMDDDDDTEECIKRQQQQQQQLQADPIAEDQSELPSITYASPDYRPPPPPDALWLQPPPPSAAPSAPSSSAMLLDDDLTDEDDAQSVLTPSTSLQHAKTQYVGNASNSPPGGYGVQHPM